MKQRGKKVMIVEHTKEQWKALQDDAHGDIVDAVTTEDALVLALKVVRIHCTLDGLLRSDLTAWQLSYLGSLFRAASNCRLKLEEEGQTP